MDTETFLVDVGRGVYAFLLDVLALVGLGLGGAGAAAAPWINDLRQDALQHDPTLALSAELAAEGVLKNQMDRAYAQNEAALNGIRQERFDAMVRTIGNPPGPAELLRMLQRDIIDQPTAHQGMRESYLRDEWVDLVIELKDDILSTPEAVQAAVQNMLPYDVAKSAARNNGTPGDVFDTLFRTAGNPPGGLELLNLWVRGYITEADVDQGLRESRLKDKWIGPFKNLAHRKIPLRTITTLLNNGAMTDADALAHLMQLGYSQADAQALINGHKKPPKAAHRELTVAQVRELYSQRMIDRSEALFDLQAAGYSAQAAGEVLDLADTADSRAARKAAITKIRSAYDTRRIDRAQASTDLDAIGVPGALRDQLLGLWDVELSTRVAELTPADIAAAGRIGVFDAPTVLFRLQAHGYSADDALVFAQIHRAIPVTKPGG